MDHPDYRLGVHTSIRGGIHLSVERAKNLGCRTLQFFSHNPRQWEVDSITENEIVLFKGLTKLYDIRPLFIHASYLINLCSPDENTQRKSIELLKKELQILTLLEVDFLVLHPGSSFKDDSVLSLDRFVDGLKRTAETGDFSGKILIENTANSRKDIALKIKDLANILENDATGLIGGFCLDSCHAFAAGYDLTKEEGLGQLMEEINRYLGIDKVKLIHLNDSKKPLESGIDRHEHIGKGCIGEDSLGSFLKHFVFANIPVILETPKRSEADDLRNLEVVRRLVMKLFYL